MKNLCVIMGTRPEVIKLFPIINNLKQQAINLKVLYTNQHKEMGKELSHYLNLNMMQF